jgi:hypothetical protein
VSNALSIQKRPHHMILPSIADDMPAYRTGYLEPGSLHPDAIMACDWCAEDVTEGRVRFAFPGATRFCGSILHEVCFRRADTARLRRLLAAGLQAATTNNG